ncbi:MULTISPECIES: DUF2829 domain-containing protein [Loigolactobacillus]|uniref:Thoeris anti-defense 2-like domain-containing protein n=1 Tax=Loigolactobacillus backii TaxID=375175 RepID=A0A192H3Z0_9LACO|nr:MULTISPECIES: DUF2829 domain-containing protein [Loigolactobacillus]ANK59690.1 hypothetical protein AYR52_05130 [Loigolactobacillus backii]ANK63090.1 hypothetical protein AYR53_10155 [Loigolactobacillus backii]ANK64686.1 hypothetical protein AYR54_05150 [Loigolactobacillus backii]ANK66865.1 hypothetical protein AYR55_03590 [Loigolactobacillus backii]ANK69902.1 hypothetical protein AYR56_06850 [Loigolactobacillus backii]
MTFEEILPKIKQGKKAIRTGWGGSELYIFEVSHDQYQGEEINPYLLIKTNEAPTLSMFQPTSCDVLADDWQLVE